MNQINTHIYDKSHRPKPIQSQKISFSPPFLEELLCPVCLENSPPDIYACVIGYDVCKECRSRTLLCSKCQNQFLEPNARNFTLEFSILVSCQECPYKSLHCQVGPFKKLFKKHEINCEYMSIICPLIGHNNCCEDTLKISEIVQHFYNLHEGDIYSQNCVDIKTAVPNELDIQSLEHITHAPYIVEFEGNIFLIQMHEHFPKQSLFCFCITRLGKTIENQKYGLKVKIQGLLHSIQWKTELLHVSYVGVGFICNLSDFYQNIATYDSRTGAREIIIEHEFYEVF